MIIAKKSSAHTTSYSFSSFSSSTASPTSRRHDGNDDGGRSQEGGTTSAFLHAFISRICSPTQARDARMNPNAFDNVQLLQTDKTGAVLHDY